VNLSQVIQFVTGKWSISFRAWMFLTPLSALMIAGNSSSYYKLNLRDTLLLILISTISSSFITIFLNFTLLKDRKKTNQPLLKVVIAYLLIWLSLVIPQSYFLINHLEYPLNIGLSIFSQMIPILSALFAFSFIFALNEKIFLDKSKIDFALDQLKIIQKKAVKNNSEQVQNTISLVSKSIKEPLIALTKQIGAMKSDKSKLLEISHELEKYSELIVRAASHEIYTNAERVNKIDRNIFRGSTDSSHKFTWFFSNLSPIYTLLSIAAVTGFSQMSINGFAGLLFVFALELVISPVLFLGARLLKTKNFQKFWNNLILIFAVLLACGILITIFSSILLKNVFIFTYALYPSGIAFRIVSIIFGGILVSSMIKSDVDNYQKIVETNELLEGEIALLENLSKNNGVKIAKLLHGPVQGKIAGVVLALRIYANNERVVTEQEVDKIKSLLVSIDDDLERIINPDRETVKVQLISALDTVKNDWKELIEIDIVYDKSFESTSLNSLTANIVEVLNESISNSLRHGSADKVEIKMEVANSHLNMIVKDNGTGIKKEYAPGFGMSVYKANLFQHSIAAGENGGCVLKLTTKVNH
jgi:hypothetical protein